MHQKQPPAKVAFLNAWSSGWGALRACPPAAGEIAPTASATNSTALSIAMVMSSVPVRARRVAQT